MEELRGLAISSCLHIITITETFTHPEVQDPEVSIPNMTIYRCDRKHYSRGGVAVYVYNSLQVDEIPIAYPPDLPNPDHEAILLKISTRQLSFHLLCIYRPPASTNHPSPHLIKIIKQASNTYDRLLITGDFNAPNIDWSNSTARSTSPYECALANLVAEYPLIQHIKDPTRHRPNDTPSLLDLIITLPQLPISNVLHKTPLGHSDHDCLIFTIPIEVPQLKFLSKPNYRKASVGELLAEAVTKNWDPPTPYSVEGHWEKILNNIRDIETKCVPPTTDRKSDRPPPRIRRAKERKNRSYEEYRALPCEATELAYKQATDDLETARAAERNRRNNQLADKIQTDKRPLYALFKAHQRGSRPAPPRILKPDGSSCESNQEAATCLLNYFASVYQTDNQLPAPSFPPRTQHQMEDFTFTCDAVYNTLSHLQPHKSPGPDTIHPFMLKSLAQILAPHLTELLNHTLVEGIPNDWKKALVTPLHKAGPKSSPANYRPISLTSTVSKVAEKIIRNAIVSHMARHNLLSPHQHGFVANHSTVTNLLHTLDLITEAVDNGESVDIIYLDMQKAFDTVNHRLLMIKVKAYGVHPSLCRWVEDFLTARTFRVRVEDSVSPPSQVSSGVPQGSVLGPLLFLLYINDLPDNLLCDSPFFADDGKIISVGPDKADLQRDLGEVVAWADRWKMAFNATKTQHLHFGNGESPSLEMNNTSIQTVEKAKDLGVIISTSLKPTEHITAAINKATAALYATKRLFPILTPQLFLSCYHVYIRPLLEYAVQSWSPGYQNDIARLEQFQRKATRMVDGITTLPYEERLQRLGLFSLARRRLRGDLIETFRILTQRDQVGRTLFQLRNNEALRGHSLTLMKSQVRTNTRLHFFSQRVITPWNSLTESIVTSTTVQIFKSRLDAAWLELFPDIL